ncbi:MAG: hypothetical protein ACTH7O_04095 [Microbacterium gubbeenense]|uniref:hypothetical protein n=1 Tax=Microbacterium gubbeenense TaxID=159896 RepID=UPI003F97C4E2
MSTDSRRAHRTGAMRRRYARTVGVVLAFFVVIGGAAAAVSITQGPRVTDVQADPAAATGASGSRVILTANQSLGEIGEDQVTVEPETEFTVDAAGRTVGVRFPIALDAGTKYTVTVAGAQGIGGGPEANLSTTFTTPPAGVLALERDPDGDDRIVSRTIGGSDATPVFTAENIDDFRATSAYLVASIVDEETMRVIVVDRASGEQADAALPGPGTVLGLQVSERGQLYGFTFTDQDVSAESGRKNVLFTGSLAGAFDHAEPDPVVVGGEEPSIDRWRFVPEKSSLLLNDFSGDLTLVDRTDPEGEVSSFGTALSIEGVARSTYTALIDRIEEGFVELDLATGEQQVVSTADLGGERLLGHMIPLADGGTLRSYALLEEGIPTTSDVVIVDPEGEAREVASTSDGEALQQVCASPSVQYIAVAVSPIAGNAYGGQVQTLPQEIETRIYDADTGDLVEAWPGFDISWCEVGPW